MITQTRTHLVPDSIDAKFEALSPKAKLRLEVFHQRAPFLQYEAIKEFLTDEESERIGNVVYSWSSATTVEKAVVKATIRDLIRNV